jgi:hypothetical protein
VWQLPSLNLESIFETLISEAEFSNLGLRREAGFERPESRG